jgi:glucan phosphoethanolaminetransferase (alkaline phosphatase superfamily)
MPTVGASSFQNKWFILAFFLGFVLLSNNLLWVFKAGLQVSYIIKISLGVSVILSCTALTSALQAKPFSQATFISSGWVGVLIAWLLCVWAVRPRERGTWILENLGSSMAALAIFLVIAGFFFLIATAGFRLAGRRSVPPLSVWVCFGAAFFVSQGLLWIGSLGDRSVQ